MKVNLVICIQDRAEAFGRKWRAYVDLYGESYREMGEWMDRTIQGEKVVTPPQTNWDGSRHMRVYFFDDNDIARVKLFDGEDV